jgi:hypothetical protein
LPTVKSENAGLEKSSAKNLDNCIGESGKKSISWMPLPGRIETAEGHFLFSLDVESS